MSEVLFANAVAKSKEKNLFSGERLSRLIDCTSLDDAVRVLAEVNYGGGVVIDDSADFEKILKAEEALTDGFLRSLKTEGKGTECFLLMSDYHNVKAILKSAYGNAELAPMLASAGLYDIALLQEKLVLDTPGINPYIDSAVIAIRRAFDTKKSPRLIDTLIDKAMFRDIANRLSDKNTDTNIKKYFVSLADLTNIDSFLRAKAIGAGFGFFEASFAEGGSIPIVTFEKAYNGTDAGLIELVKGTPYSIFAASYAERGLVGLGAARDDYLLDIFRAAKNDMFSAAPIAGYYLGKKQEIRMLRIALVCIKSGVSKQEIKKRMRTMYAE